MGKLTKEELAAPVDYRNKGELSPDDIKAFEARREWMQARFREQYGEEATFYRGVSGRYAGGLPDLREPNEVKTYALSSWTPRRSIANEFAKGSAGLVVATTIRASDVWLMPRRGVESPFRIADAKDEVVILNKGKTRTMRRP
jgi:hypothetical protein